MDSDPKAFTEIALSLSGGGYRAAAFHLGTLSMLERLGLLANVRMLSTVSGGTIAGVAYAGSLAENITFSQFYRKLYNFLHNTNVIKAALSQIQESTSINQVNAMPSLIRAAARVYSSEELLGSKTFELLFNENSVQLKELAFNATDFRTGGCFRFQKSDSPQVRTGNNKAEVDPDVNRMIRLADIVAASSCFPSGFEPIRFPSDFVWSQEIGLENIKRQLGGKFKDDIPLMDGGVFDNQGIDSIENIFKRKDREIELYIISDTDQRDASLFEFPQRFNKSGLSLNQIYILMWFLFAASLLTITAITADAVYTITNNNLTWFKGIFLYFIPLSFSLVVIFLIIWGRSFVIDMQQRVFEKTGIELWSYLKNLKIPEVVELADSRIKSLIAMASSIFMKRIRDLGYSKIFANTDFERKLIPNLIYDMDNESRWGREIIAQNLQPSEKLREVSRKAESYSTNLWFLDRGELDNLIFCGQANMCFKVLKYLLRYRSAEIKIDGSPEAELYKNVSLIWNELNN